MCLWAIDVFCWAIRKSSFFYWHIPKCLTSSSYSSMSFTSLFPIRIYPQHLLKKKCKKTFEYWFTFNFQPTYSIALLIISFFQSPTQPFRISVQLDLLSFYIYSLVFSSQFADFFQKDSRAFTDIRFIRRHLYNRDCLLLGSI